MPSRPDDQGDSIGAFGGDRDAGPAPVTSHRQRTISGCLLGIATISACNLVAGGLVALIYALVR